MNSLRMTIILGIVSLILVSPVFGGAATIVQSIAESGGTATPSDNDFTRIDNAAKAAADGDTILLQGVFDWTEANAAASWALGSDGMAATGDDYWLSVPPTSNLTLSAATLGDATIQGPGDLAITDLEGALVFSDGAYPGLEVSNLEILDFDLPIAMFFTSTTDFNDLLLTNNRVRTAVDLHAMPPASPTSSATSARRLRLRALVDPAVPRSLAKAVDGFDEAFQNIGIHVSFGTNQTISNNVIEIPGNGVSDSSDPDPNNHVFAATIALQSNTSGGSVYDGLLIDGNEVRVLNAPSADPERIYGIWENAHGHSSNITVSNNRFLSLSAGNDPASNRQQAFRVTSHSSPTTTVTYDGNEVRGANLGLAQLTGFGGQDFSAYDPIQVIGNTFLDNETAVLIRSMGSDVLRCNRFFGNALAIGNEGVVADADALENWFGCNAGPGFGSCDSIDPEVDASTWITMGLAVSDPSLKTGETATVTTDLVRVSGGGFAGCDMPDGAMVSFSADNGSMTPTMATLSAGLAQSTFTTSGNGGIATVAALLDGQVEGLFLTIDATETNLSVTKTDNLFQADGGSTLDYVIVATNEGPSNVTGATVQDVLPSQLTGCTWTCTPINGGDCTAGGTGDVDDAVDLPVGASVRYDLSCTFQPGTGGFVVNTVTVAVPAGMSDLDTSDDTASDLTYDSAYVMVFTDGFESGDTLRWSSQVP